MSRYTRSIPFLNLTVADVMTGDPLTVERGTTLATLRDLFERYRYNALPVVDGDQLCGLITQFDLLHAFLLSPQSKMPHYDAILRSIAGEIMVSNPETVTPEQALNRVLMRMIESRHKSFPVIEAGRVVGVIAREDIFKGLREESRTRV